MSVGWPGAPAARRNALRLQCRKLTKLSLVTTADLLASVLCFEERATKVSAQTLLLAEGLPNNLRATQARRGCRGCEDRSQCRPLARRLRIPPVPSLSAQSRFRCTVV